MKFLLSVDVAVKDNCLEEGDFAGTRYFKAELEIKDPEDEYVGNAHIDIYDTSSSPMEKIVNMNTVYYRKAEIVSIPNHIKLSVYQTMAYYYADHGYEDIHIHNFKIVKISD